MFCSECKNKNAKNALYCSKCGNKLGERCEESNNIKSFFVNLFNNIKGMFLQPIDTAKSFIKDENYMNGLICLSINVVLAAIFVLILFKSFSNLLFNNLSMNMYDVYYPTMEMPYFRIFLISIMTVFIVYGLMAGLSYLICYYIMKSKTSFYKIVSWLGINSLFNTIASVIMVLSMLISTKLGILVYLIGTILFIYNLFSTFEYSTDVNKNKLGYILMCTILITFLIVVVILPKIFF